MALFKINKGLATNLAKNMPYAKEGFAYFTKDDGKFYIDIDGDGTTTKAEINVNRIPLNAYISDVLKASSMPTNDSKVYPILAFNITDSTKNLVEAKYTQIGIKNGSLVIPNVVGKDEILISNTGTGRGIVIDNTNGTGYAIEIIAGKGIKVAKDPTENLELTTKQYVDNGLKAIDNKIGTVLSANDALVFKGIIDGKHPLPTTGYEVGHTYRVNEAGTYAGQKCEQGDLIICIADALSTSTPHWTVAQTNIDGAVIGPNASTVNAVSTFADATGKVIKDNPKVTIDNTGLFTAPYIATGTDKTHYFQSAKFRGEGNADTYYHAIDFGYSGHNQVDFHEYGGIWNFYENTKGTAADGKLVASIKPDGFHGNLNGNATSANKVNNNLVIKLNNGTTEGTNQFTYNGSATKNINITPANIGAASSSHNHDSSYVKKSGDTMTGDLKFQKTNSDGTTSITATLGATTGYITGTWLQITNVGNKAGDFATIDSSGWIYKRTPAQAREDMGLSTAMHFIGKATVDITDGSIVDPKITGYTTKTAGDVIIDKNNSYEYVWTLEGKWERLGPDGSYSVVGHTHNYLPLSGGALTGDLQFVDSSNNNCIRLGTAGYPDYELIEIGGSIDRPNIWIQRPGSTWNIDNPRDTNLPSDAPALSISDQTNDTGHGNNRLTFYISKHFLENGTETGFGRLWLRSYSNREVQLKGVYTPEEDTDAANKYYVDDQISTKNTSLENSILNTVSNTYVKKAGDTMSGNLTISRSDANDTSVRTTNSNGSIGLLTSTNQGLYDYTNSKWILYHNKSNGINYFNGLATKATQDKNGLQIDTNYLKLSGGTMSGKITFKFTTSKPAKGARLPVLSGQYQNGSGAYYSTDLMDMIGTASTNINNAAVRFGSTNGATFITSGEGGCVFPSKLASNLVDCEHINFCSDGGFHFWGNIANNGSSYTSYMAMDGSKIQAYQPLYGAVWNDYAEFREGDTIDAGRCVVEVGNDTLITSTERLMPGANITSDTFGFAIGETEQAKTPIAVSGRVLAYPYESREEFKKNIGRPVCSGPNGTVSIMTDEEYRDKGYCAIGTISAVPEYEEWGTGKVKVNGRVWIKVF